VAATDEDYFLCTVIPMVFQGTESADPKIVKLGLFFILPVRLSARGKKALASNCWCW